MPIKTSCKKNEKHLTAVWRHVAKSSSLGARSVRPKNRKKIKERNNKTPFASVFVLYVCGGSVSDPGYLSSCSTHREVHNTRAAHVCLKKRKHINNNKEQVFSRTKSIKTDGFTVPQWVRLLSTCIYYNIIRGDDKTRDVSASGRTRAPVSCVRAYATRRRATSHTRRARVSGFAVCAAASVLPPRNKSLRRRHRCSCFNSNSNAPVRRRRRKKF